MEINISYSEYSYTAGTHLIPVPLIGQHRGRLAEPDASLLDVAILIHQVSERVTFFFFLIQRHRLMKRENQGSKREGGTGPRTRLCTLVQVPNPVANITSTLGVSVIFLSQQPGVPFLLCLSLLLSVTIYWGSTIC